MLFKSQSIISQMVEEWTEDENEEAPKGYLLNRNPNSDYVKDLLKQISFSVKEKKTKDKIASLEPFIDEEKKEK